MSRNKLAAGVALLVACGGASSTDVPNATSGDAAANGDAGASDASLPPADGATARDAGPEDGRGAVDATTPDGARECADPDAAGCYTCCATAHSGSGFELVFFQECESCGAPPSSCSSTKICDPSAAALPSAECFACLDPKLNGTASGWQQCQKSDACAPFVACIKGCPTTR
jgi:hypothetical protein